MQLYIFIFMMMEGLKMTKIGLNVLPQDSLLKIHKQKVVLTVLIPLYFYMQLRDA
jgi:hypothetical protein